MNQNMKKTCITLEVVIFSLEKRIRRAFANPGSCGAVWCKLSDMLKRGIQICLSSNGRR